MLRFEKKEKVSKNDVFKVLEESGKCLGEIKYKDHHSCWGFDSLGVDRYMSQKECEVVAAKLKELNNAEI